MVNFRCSHNDVREIANEKFCPLILELFNIDRTTDSFDPIVGNYYAALHWFQSGSRHNPYYYQRLKKALASVCFGGYIDDSTLPGEIIIYSSG